MQQCALLPHDNREFSQFGPIAKRVSPPRTPAVTPLSLWEVR